MTKRQRKMLWRIGISAGLLVAAVLIPYDGPWQFLLFLPAYGVIGWDVLWKAVRNIAHGQIFDENFLMALATVGAFGTGFFGQGEYPEAVFVMLFYQVGEFFQGYAVGKSRRSITQLMDIRPDYARVIREGALVQVDPEEVAIGEEIVVKPGEKVPLDGTVVEGSSTLDTSALTGESMPRRVAAGDGISSGCLNLSGLLTVRVEKEFGQSTVAKILELVENSGAKKARLENFITRFARVYTPAVVLGAVLIAVVPSLVWGGWAGWIHRALMFLVVSCPCALVVSVPLSFFGGIGGASRAGILVKGGSFLEMLAQTRTVVFDKTGTLTQGDFSVTQVCPASGVTREELLETAALAEHFSDHPIARSLQEAWGSAGDPARLSGVEEISGKGVRARIDGKTVLVGSRRLLEKAGVPCAPVEAAGTVVHAALAGRYLGYAVISDRVKPDAREALAALKAQGVRQTVMLTGDTPQAAQAVGRELGLDTVYAGLLPGDKVDRVEDLLRSCGPKARLAFVGDGINDAPVLSRADVGIAMGALGSDAAIEAADVVLMDDKPSKLALAMEISKGTLRIVRENIGFALGVKAAVLLLSALGYSTMWAAVFADVGVLILAVLNASRALWLGRGRT